MISLCRLLEVAGLQQYPCALALREGSPARVVYALALSLAERDIEIVVHWVATTEVLQHVRWNLEPHAVERRLVSPQEAARRPIS